MLAKNKGGLFGGSGAGEGGEPLDVDDDAENAAPGNGSDRRVGESDRTEDVVARARARIAEARAQGRLDPDVSARATMLARGAGAPPAPPAPAPRASSSSSRGETAGSTPPATTPPSDDA